MYIPSSFCESRIEQQVELIRRNPFAILILSTSEGLVANHLPMLYEKRSDGSSVLHGHVSRANPMWRHVDSDIEALAIFQGNQGYISPSWYKTKSQTGRVVPTWNYAVVHAYGRAETYTDPILLRKHLEGLTLTHEAGFHKPWKLNDAPDEFISELLNAIVGVDLRVSRFEGKWKVSQNRSVEDRAGVIEGLRRTGNAEGALLAEMMLDYLQT